MANSPTSTVSTCHEPQCCTPSPRRWEIIRNCSPTQRHTPTPAGPASTPTTTPAPTGWHRLRCIWRRSGGGLRCEDRGITTVKMLGVDRSLCPWPHSELEPLSRACDGERTPEGIVGWQKQQDLFARIWLINYRYCKSHYSNFLSFTSLVDSDLFPLPNFHELPFGRGARTSPCSVFDIFFGLDFSFSGLGFIRSKSKK